jgi:hypothetical protein
LFKFKKQNRNIKEKTVKREREKKEYLGRGLLAAAGRAWCAALPPRAA